MPAKLIASPRRDREPGIATRDLRPFGPRPDFLERPVRLSVDEFEGNYSPRRLRQEREAPSVPPDKDSEKPQEEDHPRCHADGDAAHVRHEGERHRPQQGPCDEDVGEGNDSRKDANASYRFGRWHENPEGPETDIEDLGVRVTLRSRPKEQSFAAHFLSAESAENISLASAPIGAGPHPLAC